MKPFLIAICFFVVLWVGCYMSFEVYKDSWKAIPMIITVVITEVCLWAIFVGYMDALYGEEDNEEVTK